MARRQRRLTREKLNIGNINGSQRPSTRFDSHT